MMLGLRKMQVIYSSWKHRNRSMSNDRWSGRKVMASSKQLVTFTRKSFTLIHRRSGCIWGSSERWRRLPYVKMKGADREMAWAKVRALYQRTQSNGDWSEHSICARAQWEMTGESGRRRWEAITAGQGDRSYLLGKQEVPGGFRQGDATEMCGMGGKAKKMPNEEDGVIFWVWSKRDVN